MEATAMREFIPFTQARRDRLYQQYLHKEVGDKDGLALVEWEDGSITFRPVIWESDLSMLIDPETQDFWFARGRGAEPKDFNGIPVWRVYAGNAGVISTEACLVGDSERWNEVVDVGAGDEVPDELFELGLEDPNGGRSHSAETESPTAPIEGPTATPGTGNGRGRARADGGAAVDAPDDAAIYDLRPPSNFDGQTIDVRDADDFDPFPVTREDAKAAAEWFERATDDSTDTWMKGFIVGLVVFAVIWLLMTIIPWLLGEIGGADASGAGESLTGILLLLAVPARGYAAQARDTVVDAVRGAVR